jgi:hypothetical protein
MLIIRIFVLKGGCQQSAFNNELFFIRTSASLPMRLFTRPPICTFAHLHILSSAYLHLRLSVSL